MKTLVSLLIMSFAAVQIGFAQPDAFNYQTVVRNSEGVPMSDQEVSFRMSVRQGSANGTIVYQETHSANTNEHGLVSFRIGEGSSSDELADVNWGNNSHYLQTELDPEGGNSYEDMGTTQLVSVPYALHAKSAEDVDDADADPTNELQNLSINGSTLSISSGNSVELPGGDAPDPESTAKAWVNFPIVGTPNLTFDAYNVASTSVVNTGVRLVSLPPGLFSIATNPACICQVRNDLAPGFCVVTSGAAPSQVTVRTYNTNGQLADKEFSLVIFGK